MKPYMEGLGQSPGFFADFFAPQTAWKIWLRNYMFAFIAWSRILDLIQKYFCGAFENFDKYKLLEYE